MSEFPIPGEILREHLQALGALAQRLVRDRHAAEDAVQDTMLAALTSKAPRSGALRSWLAAILKNRVRQDARAQTRRTAREAARPAPAASPSASEVVMELQLHRRLVEFVHGTDEPVRQVLFLRFWRGLSPRAIAMLIAVPEKTVHARIERALARLRAQLDAEYAERGGRPAWAAVLSALAPLKPAALGLASLGLLMKTKLLVGASVVIAVLALLPFLEPGGANARTEQADGLGPEPAVASAAPPGVDANATPTAREAVTPSIAPAAVEAPQVTGFVRDLGGRPVAGAAVVFERLQGTTGFARDPGVPVMTSAADGSFALAWPAREGWLTVGEGPWAAVRRAWCSSELPTQPPVVITAPARRYSGSVVDPAGAPVAGARVAVVVSDALAPARDVGGAIVALPNDLATVTTDAGGHFAIASGWIPGSRLAGECAPFGAASCALPEVDAADLLLRLLPPPDDPRVHGIVLDARSQPAAGAWVAVGADSVRCGSDGRFAAPWQGKHRPTWVRAVQPGAGAVTARLVPGADQPGWQADRPIMLQLPPTPREIRGRVVDAAGSPCPGVHVWTPDLTWFGNVTVDHQGHPVLSGSSVEGMVNDPNAGMDAVLELGTTTDGDGEFVLRGLMDRTYPLFAMAPVTLAATGPLVATPGNRVELQLEAPQLHRVAGRLVDDIGCEPLAGVRVAVGRRLAWERPQRTDDPWAGSTMMPAGASHLFREATVATDADGRFALPPLQTAGAYLWFQGEVLFLAPPFQLADDQPHADLRIALPARSTFHLQLERPGEADKFSIVGTDGKQQPLFVRVEGAVISIWRVELVDGRSPAAYTRAGDVVLVLSKNDVEVRRATVTLRAGEHDVRL